jgi:hypothetical protein
MRARGSGILFMRRRACSACGPRRAARQSWRQCYAGDAERKGKKLTGWPGVSAATWSGERGELGLGRRWAEHEVEEEVDCWKEKNWPRAGEEEGSGPWGGG